MRLFARTALTAALAAALSAVVAASAQAAPRIASFYAANCKVETCEKAPLPIEEKEKAEAEGFTKAGGHPPFGVTDFRVSTTGKEPEAAPEGVVTHVRTDVAPGVSTDPQATPKCTFEEFGREFEPGGHHTGLYLEPECDPESEIGINKVLVYLAAENKDLPLEGTVYNLEQPIGLASDFGVALELPKPLTEALLGAKGLPPLFAHTLIEGNVEWGAEAEGTGKADYHDYFTINVSPLLPLIESRLDFFGKAGEEEDFLTNPTSCTGVGPQTTTTLKVRFEKGESSEAAYTTPIGASECNLVPFAPGFALSQSTKASDTPDGLTAELSLPHGSTETDDSQVKTATVTLPPGITLDPSGAAGLEDCTPAEIGIGTKNPVACPEGSKLGTLTLNVPGLPTGSLQGNIYLGGPASGPITGPPYVIYLDAESERYGVSVRLRGVTTPNETTGQLTTTFSENPEQPFTNLILRFKGGPLAPLANLLHCESATTATTFTPYSGGAAASPAAGFEISGCPSTFPFSLAQTTVAEPNIGGGHTSYSFELGRANGQQYLQKIKTTLPAGLVGEIPDVTLCGEPQAAAGECGSASRIGTATVAAGAGSSPFTFTGPVYMTGPFEGAPFGLSIAVPAVAGPFNLGKVITRSAIRVDPLTARVTAETTLPTIVKGVPLRLRDINVTVNRQGFLLSPTSCAPEATETTLTSTFGTLQENLSSPFQSEGCASLAFNPSFAASTSGKPTKADGASLVTTISQGAGQANIKSVLVTLPLQLPSRLSTLNKACLAAVFNANPAACPAESMVGSATAVTPVLPGTMKGTAYYISHGGEEFPDLDVVLEDDGVRTILVGNTKITKGITTTNFAASPDVPVSSFTLNLAMGRFSALAAPGNLCAPTLLMPTVITAQNGKQVTRKTVITPVGCGVQVLSHKVIGSTAYVTVKTFEAGRISLSGPGLKTTYRTLNAANKAITLKIPLTSKGKARRRPFNVRLRVGFKPKSRKAKVSQAFATVRFRH